MATLYLNSVLERGEDAAVFLFEERQEIFLRRAESLNLPVRSHLETGRLHVREIDTAEVSPGEVAGMLREAVEGGAGAVLLDSLTGYFHSMAHSEMLLAQMHEMLNYLGRHGVLALLVVAQHGLVGPRTETPTDVSYMADTVVLLRYFEAAGQVRKGISVVKKRHGGHERSVRELRLSDEGIEVGAPITDFRGVLSGELTYTGSEDQLMYDNREKSADAS
jgi:circadian clock protein KaiC